MLTLQPLNTFLLTSEVILLCNDHKDAVADVCLIKYVLSLVTAASEIPHGCHSRQHVFRQRSDASRDR